MDQSTWEDILAAMAASPYPVHPLPPDLARAEASLASLGMTTRSWLGAVVANSSGLLLDHGWLRVLGSGGGGLPDVAAAADSDGGGLLVAYDVLGGRFAWMPPEPGAPPTVHYFGPDTLDWQDLKLGYGDWLHAMIAGWLTRFYEALRWPGWEAEVSSLAPDRGLSVYPPPWSEEGKDLSAVSRQPAPLLEVAALYRETARQT